MAGNRVPANCFRLRPGRGRVRFSTEVSTSGSVSFSIAILGAKWLSHRPGYDAIHIAENGGRRDLRSPGRRVSPLLGRRTLACATFRKDSVRSCTTRLDLHLRLSDYP